MSAPVSHLWFQGLILLGLLGVGAVAAMDHLALVHLTEQAANSTQEQTFRVLEERLSRLDDHVQHLGDRPEPVKPSDLEAVRTSLDERLARVEASSDTPESVLQGLEARMARVEGRLSKPQPSTTVKPQRTPEIKPKESPPPFVIRGTEIRGGELFLSVSPGDTPSLAQIRLLRAGESQYGWQLQNLENGYATFHVPGQGPKRLPLP